ncbi:flavodoxin domain-containing protein [Priestia endophytica]
MNILIAYESLSGNTEEVAEIIEEELSTYEVSVKIHDLRMKIDDELIASSDLLLIGSYTWGDGELPDRMRKFLKSIIKEKQLQLPPVAIFGTGDTDFYFYCRAVDEMAFHLGKVTKVINTLKNEQAPRSKNQIRKVKEFAHGVMEVMLNGK